MNTTEDTARGVDLLLRASVAALLMSGFTLAAHAQEAITKKDADKDELQEVIVTGVRASLVQSLVEKRQSTQVIETVVADDIGKLPDNNVVEAMQRLSRVQISNRSGGEAQA